MAPDQLGRLRDILQAAQLIASYVRGVTKPQFVENIEKQDAVVRRIEIIGEATAHLAEATRELLPELPFRKIRGMRNIVAHDYSHVNTDVVWDVANVYIPQMISVLEPFLATQAANQSHSAEVPPVTPSNLSPTTDHE